MASGHSNQLTKQIGEHLVAAELGRRDLIATPFAGNVPMYGLLVADQRGHAIPVQVKAINRGSSWQFQITSFLDMKIIKGIQKITGSKALVYPNLICLFVVVKSAGLDDFYIFTLQDLQKHFRQNYKGGRRTKNPESTHCAIWPKHLVSYKDKWGLITDTLALQD
jgi:hypothetical protein